MALQSASNCSTPVISGHQWSSVVISGHQWSSVVISGQQWSSVVISTPSPKRRSISGHQHTEPDAPLSTPTTRGSLPNERVCVRDALVVVRMVMLQVRPEGEPELDEQVRELRVGRGLLPGRVDRESERCLEHMHVDRELLTVEGGLVEALHEREHCAACGDGRLLILRSTHHGRPLLTPPAVDHIAQPLTQVTYPSSDAFAQVARPLEEESGDLLREAQGISTLLQLLLVQGRRDLRMGFEARVPVGRGGWAP